MNQPNPDSSAPCRILVADDHPLFREGVVQWLNRQGGFVCCGEAANPAQILNAVATLQPDLVLLDLRLGNHDGIDLIKVLKDRHPTLRILVLSQHDESVYAERVLRAGAMGYVMKDHATTEVLEAVQSILRGEAYVSRRVAARLLGKLLDPRTAAARSDLGQLSNRELQIYQMLGSGLSTRDIAAQLGVSFKTVETHRENIKRKLDLADAAQLIHHATIWVTGAQQPPAS